ncbi:GNAT family protein [Pengzhenrongella sp.]|jgi:ribosomal-protein-alanine N-acetyltransferase|uniref:GNAT family N-acetyltransferase n=1 Tax=Pengzhenrongella sp. TaxID=2888820 RepID=UPI002F92561E
MITTRLIRPDDVPELVSLLLRNREFLAPWSPVRGDDYATAEIQRVLMQAALEQCELGTTLPHVILDDDGDLVGRITLNGIVRGPFQSCSVGYWVGETDNGRGVATAAVRDIVRVAFEELGLHRLQAETMLHNVRSQRVLERAGFTRYGIAPAYLKIAGTWQDHILWQTLSPTPQRPSADVL